MCVNHHIIEWVDFRYKKRKNNDSQITTLTDHSYSERKQKCTIASSKAVQNDPDVQLFNFFILFINKWIVSLLAHTCFVYTIPNYLSSTEVKNIRNVATSGWRLCLVYSELWFSAPLLVLVAMCFNIQVVLDAGITAVEDSQCWSVLLKTCVNVVKMWVFF